MIGQKPSSLPKSSSTPTPTPPHPPPPPTPTGCGAGGGGQGGAEERGAAESVGDLAHAGVRPDDRGAGGGCRAGGRGKASGSCGQVEGDERRAAERHPQRKRKTMHGETGINMCCFLLWILCDTCRAASENSLKQCCPTFFQSGIHRTNNPF